MYLWKLAESPSLVLLAAVIEELCYFEYSVEGIALGSRCGIVITSVIMSKANVNIRCIWAPINSIGKRNPIEYNERKEVK